MSTGRRSVLAFATRYDIIVIAASSTVAILAGALNPFLTIFYGQLVRTFANFIHDPTNDGIELRHGIARFTLYFVYLAIAEFGLVYLATVGFYHVGERIVTRLRYSYLSSILTREKAFFDTLSIGEVVVRLTDDTNNIHDGLTTKLAITITAISTFSSALVISFVEYWRLATTLIVMLVFVVFSGFAGGHWASKYKKQAMRAQKEASSLAEEVLGSIKHVMAYGIQQPMINRFLTYVHQARAHGIRAGAALSASLGFMNGVPYLTFGLCFWVGSIFVYHGKINGHQVVTTALAAVIGQFALQRIAPNAQAFISCFASANAVLDTIAESSAAVPQPKTSLRGQTIDEVGLEQVQFLYQSRPDTIVLDNISIRFSKNTKTAIVGASGCGKTSILAMLEQFYEPTQGRITVNGRDITSYNVYDWRNLVSYVGQDPFLFDTTIFENIALGCEGTSRTGDIQQRVKNAAEKAYAHEFIMTLPKGYDTRVGERGECLSRGQRQRIVIARALIRDPKILLLDEPTAALDVVSENYIQKTFETFLPNCITIIVSHRLHLVKSADNIVVMSKGKIVEQGTHEHLITTQGAYYRMVNEQVLGTSDQLQHATDEPMSSEKDPRRIHTFRDTTDSNESVDVGISRTSTESTGNTADVRFTWSDVYRLALRLSREDMWTSLLGICCAFIAGLAEPIQSIFFAKLIQVLSLPVSEYHRLRIQADFWCWIYLALGLSAILFNIMMYFCFSYTSEKLASRARELSIRTILSQDLQFFYQPGHSAAALTAFLLTGASALHNLSGAILGSMLSFAATILGGIVIALIVGWKLALVCTATIPLMAGSGWARVRVLNILQDNIKKSQHDSASYAGEAVAGIDAVKSMGLESYVLAKYTDMLSEQASRSLKSVLKASVWYAASQSVNFLCAALAFWYGGTLIASREHNMFQFFVCFAALISGAQSAGSIFTFAPDISRAFHAAQDLATLLASKPSIGNGTYVKDPVGTAIINEKTTSLQANDIDFAYPSEPRHLVLSNVALSVNAGQHIGIVGHSGCGKSTIISLIERYFDPTAGSIKYSDQDIRELDLNAYRQQISLVSQDTILYQGTIHDNITLGSNRLPASIPSHEIDQACREACILDFITSLPQGFDTPIGPRGTLLSGGQRQRLSIARALLRNPKVLLLDEATAALDSSSERVVQKALENVATTRTTISVAHRLSTVRDAHCIFVMEKGKVVERGTHGELLESRGLYWRMVREQQCDK